MICSQVERGPGKGRGHRCSMPLSRRVTDTVTCGGRYTSLEVRKRRNLRCLVRNDEEDAS